MADNCPYNWEWMLTAQPILILQHYLVRFLQIRDWQYASQAVGVYFAAPITDSCLVSHE